MQLSNDLWGIVREGFDHIKLVQGLVIGILGGLMVSSVGGLFVVPLMAAIVYIAADAIIPAVTNHNNLVWPPIDSAFWHELLSLYVAFFVLIALIYVAKSIFASMRG